MRIVLLGPPGGGKGTQAVKLSAWLDVPHIATGDLFRIEIAAETDLGILANEYISNGNLVPDEVTNALAQKRLARKDAVGFVLDGYPRTLTQAYALDFALGELERPLRAAVLIQVPDDAIVGRAVGRVVCSHCGAIFHLTHKPPQVAGICDLCRSHLQVREDDTPSTVRHRLAVYHRITTPVVKHYEGQGLLQCINGVGGVEEIFQRLVAVLQQSC